MAERVATEPDDLVAPYEPPVLAFPPGHVATGHEEIRELRARRAARAAERAAFAERRRRGLPVRHAAKLARLAAAEPLPFPLTSEEEEAALNPRPEVA